MNITKRLLSILLFTAISVGAWALSQNSSGTYLVGSLQDWIDFAEIVNTSANSSSVQNNAIMTADIDLGNNQTMIGTGSAGYRGTFDGNGHCLTIAYTGPQDGQFFAPFRYVANGTIKNLTVKGTNSAYCNNSNYSTFSSALVGEGQGCVLRNCHTDVELHAPSNTTHDWTGAGLVANAVGTLNGYGIIEIYDCLVEGMGIGVQKTGFITKYAPFIGFVNYHAKLENCLSTASIRYVSYSNSVYLGGTMLDKLTYSNLYSRYVGNVGTQQCLSYGERQLADGYIAFQLQGKRSTLVWGQQVGVDPIPVLTTDTSKRLYRTDKGFANSYYYDNIGIKRDKNDGYYLIASYFDWIEFASLVESNGNLNARMTDDVDLGFFQDKLGATKAFTGIFDGQGHTLTIHYTQNVPNAANSCSPFSNTDNGAVIKNLHLDGYIENTAADRPSLVSVHSSGNLTIEKVWSSAVITSTNTGWDEAAAFVACCNGTINIKDCLFTGNITSSGEEAGCFVGGVHGTVNITNSLSTGRFTLTGTNPGVRGYLDNTYIQYFPTNYPSTNYCSSTIVANGDLTDRLQKNRSEKIWVQDTEARRPTLKIFVPSFITTGEALPLNDNGQMINDKACWFTIDGRKLSGKPSAKGIYIRNGKKIILK